MSGSAEVPAIEVNGINVDYGKYRALEDVTFTVQKGTVCALLGMNGSGKSTLFNAISGALSPTAGSVKILSRTVKQAQKSGLLGYMPQAEAVDWDFPVSVHDVVMMGRYGAMGPSRRPRSRDKEAVHRSLDRVGLTEFAQRQIGRLSGGQKKRTFLARALAQNAQVLLLDEPFAGVDRVSAQTMTEVLRDLAHNGITVLITVHEIDNIAQWADEAILLRRRVVYRGEAFDVLKPEKLALAFGGEE
ncbi:metal ABC transporter ATP-binding protein [Rothia uropygialis]|uniref:metal ABC transporter ATP-binding protein n=1 Tax=Kocuria sp. 36 TaxID=1415402 RepID=UPI00101DB5BD|nr:metal ABC transporter ATP-binding protein [Kocuria sp. 36]